MAGRDDPTADSGAEKHWFCIFYCLQRGRFCPEALHVAQYVLRVLLHYTQHAHNANNTRITRTTCKTRSTAF